MDAKRILAGLAALALSAGAAHALDLPNPFGLFGDKKSEQAPGAPPPPPPDGALGVDCPEILVDSGAASLRVPPGSDNAAVRYQLSLGDMARECSMQGDQIAIKVGVEGAAVLGPAGSPGAYSGSLRVAVRRQKDEHILDSKTYRISAAVAAGATRGAFRVIADPLLVPYLGPQAADDYEILVGFEGGVAEKPAAAQKRRKRRSSATAASPD
ncbi:MULTISPECIES: hypothetical protein [Methylosinus]|uniref:Uncharacterized protein n=1 Tax=Methylosinus trichosporium (strain ATCC 35070 / NCIMB 11131 / UNIQEM 75 / OB3b) TaxID=595536 RepID=A0A2D2CZX8_METT3|nr:MULTISPECIES: hypothetical protein [Methylosinus]ATQ68179.1 hypothetical protein CQW49_10055 [Methylosinus trichosporium OB3b]OBS53444.1 hypothetical protein A8B73_05870 [Methylosinus sp. 3S-1]